MKHICTIHVFDQNVGFHLIDNHLNEFEVAVVRCKMKRCKLLVCGGVYPLRKGGTVQVSTVETDGLKQVELQRMLVDELEAL
jgi:hypothetical protein